MLRSLGVVCVAACAAKSLGSVDATPVAPPVKPVIDTRWQPLPADKPKLRFVDVGLPSSAADGARVRVSPLWAIGGQSDTVRLQRLLVEGEDRDGFVFGALYDLAGDLLPAPDGTSPWLRDSVDFAALLDVDGGLKLFNHVESPVGGFTLADLSLAPDGTVSVDAVGPVDVSAVRGVKDACSGDVTPWNSVLSGEEYEPDARRLDAQGRTQGTGRYDVLWNDHARALGDVGPSFPYDYGWMVETTVTGQDTTVVKRPAMGRFSHELGVVMPDRRTVYLSDDVGHHGGLFLFVADRAGDLSEGSLYAMRWVEQTRDTDGGAANIRWVPLGHASEAEITTLTRTRELRFSDLFSAADPLEDGRCPQVGQKRVTTYLGDECLEVRPNRDLQASRLETRRYAALQGATVEFSKAEGLTYDPNGRRVFLAISSVSGAMADDEGHVQLDANPCGGLYALEGLVGGVGDLTGKPIDSTYVARTMSALTLGVPQGEACDPDHLANPDNVAYLPDHELLIVAEDTSRHTFPTLWAFDTRTWERTRLATAPWCGEWTGVHWFPELQGAGWLTVSMQHAYDYERGGCAAPEGAWPEGEPKTWTGVFGPFPPLR